MDRFVPAKGRLLGLALVCAGVMMTAPVWAQVTQVSGSLVVDGVRYEGVSYEYGSQPDIVEAIRGAREVGESTNSITKVLLKTQDEWNANKGSEAAAVKAAQEAAAKAAAEQAAAQAAADKAAAEAAAKSPAMSALMPTYESFTKATGTNLTRAKISDLMKGSKSCVKHNWDKKLVCCKWGCGRHGDVCCKWAYEYPIDYWEPSELIEVSCRNGYSMMKPGLKGRGIAQLQSCQGPNKPGGGRYFFEARTWTINGDDGGVRHQAMGRNLGAQTKMCSMEKLNALRFDIPTTITKAGYGIKWLQFSRGSQNGPAGSYEGYISDNDDSWAKDDGAGGSAPTQKACKIGSVDIPNCWGPVTETGWVTHTNPKIAAAAVAWRAHEKARKMNKVSPADGKGYQMAMEFPFVKYGGAFAGSMGAPNGGKSGSQCFKPGDSGPDWFGGMQPQAIPDFVKGLQQGEMASVAEVNSGVYIFTIWVHTSCIRYDPFGGPYGKCYYKGLS